MRTAATLNTKVKIAEDIYLLSFNCIINTDIIPGQFFMINKYNSVFQLRHPFSIHRQTEEGFEIIISVVGDFTRELSQLSTGEVIDIIGPSGNGYLPPAGKKIIALGGGIGVAPFANFENFTENIIYAVGFKSSDKLVTVNLPKSRTVIYTEDGSSGKQGLVTDYLNSFKDDQCIIFSCGPEKMLSKTAEIARSNGLKAYFSLESYMVCGVGACSGCVSPLLKDYRKVCKDGPVFPLGDMK